MLQCAVVFVLFQSKHSIS